MTDDDGRQMMDDDEGVRTRTGREGPTRTRTEDKD